MAHLDDGGFVWMGTEPPRAPAGADLRGSGAAASAPEPAHGSASARGSEPEGVAHSAPTVGTAQSHPSASRPPRPSQGMLRRIAREPVGPIAVRVTKRLVTVALAARRGKRALLVACLAIAEDVTHELRRAARAA